MDNLTTLDPFRLEDVTSQPIGGLSTTLNPYHVNMSTASSLEIYDSIQTNITADDTPVSRDISFWIYLAVRILWGVLAVFGNSLTIFAVCRFERLQTCTNSLICSLAVCDLLAGVMVPLILVYELYPSSQFFIPVCLSQQVSAVQGMTGG